MKRILLVALCAGLCIAAAIAKPARRGMVEVEQPDGSVVTVERIGDERSHVVLSADGRALLAGDDGLYRYATIAADGRMVMTDKLLAGAKSRTAAPVDVPVATAADVDRTLSYRAANGPRRELAQEGMGLFSGNFPTKGTIKALVILVQYTDVKFRLSDPKSYFTDMLTNDAFSQYNGTGSCHKYFYDNSAGQFDPQFDVFGPVTLPNKQSYYGGNDSWGNDLRPEKMVTDAAEILRDEINFADYDMDGDGYVDNVYIYYAGLGEAGDGSANTVWPHSWNISEATSTQYQYNGVYLDRYACSNEWESGRPDGIGTFCHEFSHVMGLPDLYHTSSQAYYTPGDWSVMDYGCYANDSRTPIGFSSFERNALGWTKPMLLDGPASVALEPFATSNQCCIALTEKSTEFFLFENRQPVGWDKYIPGHGMLIWHVDFVQSVWDNNRVNNTKSHQYVDIVEANNNPSGSDAAMLGYPWPGTDFKTEFTSSTKPAFKSWGGVPVELPITNIDETAQIIRFDVDGGNHELAAPTGLRVHDVTAGSFVLKWDVVSFATDYRVDVRTDDGPVYTGLSTDGATRILVDRLEPETTYYASVKAVALAGESEPSEEVTVTTGESTFNYIIPTVLPPAEVNESSFTAAWEPVEGAVEYLLTVSYLNDDVGGEAVADFGSATSTSIELPDGWTFTGSTSNVYSSSGYYGKSAPALKMSSDGARLQTVDFGSPILSLSFWYKGNGNANDVNTLVVEGLGADGEWAEVTTVYPMSHTKATSETVDPMPADYTALRFTYNKKASGNAGVDDIVIVYGGGVKKVRLADYDERSVGDVTRWEVQETVPGQHHYCYSVKAVNADGIRTLESDDVTLTLSTVGITDVPVEASVPAEYYNLQGMRVDPARLAPGLYIERRGSQAKVVKL